MGQRERDLYDEAVRELAIEAPNHRREPFEDTWFYPDIEDERAAKKWIAAHSLNDYDEKTATGIVLVANGTAVTAALLDSVRGLITARSGSGS